MKKNILIAGGTHGNELTGIELLRKWQKCGLSQKYPDLNVQTLISNPDAFKQKVRFIDQDLNRSFSEKDLSDNTLINCEANRAKQIAKDIKGKNIEVIFDLHTTTANMGVSIILTDDNLYNLKMAAFIKANMKKAKTNILYVPPKSVNSTQHNFMVSLASNGLLIEVGPIANNIVRQDILESTEEALLLALKFIDMSNKGENIELPKNIEIFQKDKIIEFPLDKEGNICAFVHKNLQDRDFLPLKKGDPIFFTLDGKEIFYEDDEIRYPVFVNEAAYYRSNVAFSLATKKTINFI